MASIADREPRHWRRRRNRPGFIWLVESSNFLSGGPMSLDPAVRQGRQDLFTEGCDAWT